MLPESVTHPMKRSADALLRLCVFWSDAGHYYASSRRRESRQKCLL